MKPRKHLATTLTVLLAILSQSLSVFPQTDRQLTQSKPDTTEKRLALVIGNGSYRYVPPLENPVNDANDMAAALRSLGFEVIQGTDLNLAGMRKLIRDFGAKLGEQKGVGLFYYAGHGIEVDGSNYLIPVDADIKSRVETADDAVDLATVMRQMDAAGNGFNMIFLDACRSNPFRSWNRSTDSDGLAGVSAPSGTFIAYAAAPGSTAEDGKGAKNGIFTGALLRAIRIPNLSVSDVFTEAAAEVQRITNKTQIPWQASSLTGKFYFSRSDAPVAVTPKPAPLAPPTPVATVTGITAAEEEEQIWQRVSANDKRSGYEFYLKEYPRGKYAAQAGQRIERFRQEEIQRQKDVERGAWQNAERLNTRESYNAYLSAYPNGTYAADARAGIRALDARDEQSKWDEAVLLNRKAAFQSYLTAYPNGRFAVQARAKVREFEDAEAAAQKSREIAAEKAKWDEAERLNTVAAYQGYLKAYPEGSYAKSARLRLTELGVVLTPAPGTVKKSPTGIELVWVPAGEFMMGSPLSEKGRSPLGEPQRKVTIKEGFWMGRYEVTQGEWESVMGINPSFFKDCGPRCPVEQVSWDDIQTFLSRLNARDGEFEYSLPSEAQWEYAARAGTATAFAFGNSLSSTQANFDGNLPYGAGAKGPYLKRTVTVGSYQPNAWGLYDMHGNVYEWVEDIYNLYGYAGLPTDGSANVSVGDSSYRVLRGGSWFNSADNSRSALRVRYEPSASVSNVGFRVLARPR